MGTDKRNNFNTERTVDRNSLISANNDLIRRSDELWVFGEISDGVKEEIKLAESLNRQVKYFEVGEKAGEFVEKF